MACDTLVERVTGHPAGAPMPIAVNLVISDETLFGEDTSPARIPGYGPIPAAVALRLARDAVTDERSKATLRRLYRHPNSGTLVAMESKARLFPKGLAGFISIRDDTCRTPYCDAPIRHTHHAKPHRRDGATTGVNGLGECAACNYAKEAPGWRVYTVGDPEGRHVAEFVTPTGARHQSKAPPLLGDLVLVKASGVESRVAEELAHACAA
jgi:hypothetical protein